ncbi:MAG: GAF domain-containing protein [Anaerolineales bacterium]|nr:GAF domain-containing protein [Anaerolineales bacterium]
MNNSNQLTINNESINLKRVFWAAVIFTIVAFSSVVLSIFLIRTSPSWQVYSIAGISTIALIVDIIGLWLIQRDQAATGLKLLYWSSLLTVPPNVLLVTSIAPFLIGIVLFVGFIHVFFLHPRSWRKYYFFGPVIASGVILFFEWIQPPFRLALIVTSGVFSTSVLVFLIAGIFFLYLLQSWGNLAHLMRSSISNRLTTMVMVLTIPLLIGIAAYISYQAGTEIETRALHNLQQNNQSLATNVSTWFELHVRTAKEVALLPDIVSMEATRQKPTLVAISQTHPNLFLVQTTYLNGINVARSDDAELNDYHDRAWFLGAKQGAPITAEALISRTIGKPALNIATPIYDEAGKIVGVASIVSELSEISKEVLNVEEGQGITYIVDAGNHVVAHPDPTYTENELRDLSTYPPVVALSEGKTGQITFTDENNIVWIAYVDRLDNGWGIVAQQPRSELLASVRQFQTTAGIFILIGSVLMFILVWFAIRRTLQPIGVLTATVSAIAAGDANRMAEVNSQDEIGLLASTFNAMTTRLRESFATLEQRVADRTRDLELASEVGRTVSQVRKLDILLTEAAEIIRAQFDLYYVQVYLTNPSQTALILQAGTGTVGAELLSRAHQLPLNTASINGRAAIEKKSVVISDTTASSTFKPNALLPDTRSEMAVPLMIGERVVGVLDMQSREPGKLDQEGLSAYEALAGQLAIAIQNATLLAQTEEAYAEIASQARRQSRANWVDYLDAIHKPEETGFVYENNKVVPLSAVEKSHVQVNENTLSIPIEITGESIGNLVVEMEGQSPIAHTSELVNTVARQVAQQIENLRLLENAERYRFEAEEASRRITHEGWKNYIQTNAEEGIRYLYDLNEVKPYRGIGSQQSEADGLTSPLKVREETIGNLVVQGIDKTNNEAIELVNAVAERLSAHLEGLRLSNQTEQALLTTQKLAEREQALRQITSAVRSSTDPETILRSAVRELGNILGRKTIVRLTTANGAQPSQQQSFEANGNESVLPVEAQKADGGTK